MRALRHPAIQRLFSLGLLVSLTLWLAVPATGATRSALAAQAAGLGLPADVEALLGEALAGAHSAEDFAEALATSLDARPDGDALADLIEAEPEALLALLYGHLFQAFGHYDGPLVVPTVTPGATAGAAPVASHAITQTADHGSAVHAARHYAAPDRAVRPVALLTAAQPLGP